MTAVSQNQGANDSVSITGTHTPPSSGHVGFNSICFISTTNVFSSAAAGTTHLVFLNCESAVENGYFLNLPNWTGTLEIYDFNANTAGAPFSVNDGGLNNSGGATLLVFSAGFGSGTNVMTLSGTTVSTTSDYGAPINFGGSGTFSLDTCVFNAALTFSSSSNGTISTSRISSGTSAAITMSSSGNVNISDCTIQSTANPSIAGSGAGTLTLSSISFLNDNHIANTLTLGNSSVYPVNMSNGQVLIGSAGLPAVASTLTAGTGISITNGAGSITISGSGAVALTFDGDTGTATPAANTITISGGTTGLTTTAAGSTVDLTGTLNVANGGTGANTLTGVLTGNGTGAVTASTVTQHGVLVGGATNAVGSTAVGSTGQVLQGNTGANPTYSTATYPSTTTINQILFSSASNTVTGLTTADNGVLTTGTTGIPAITALSSNGQLIIGSGAGAPAAATLTAGTGISITNGANSITIAAVAGGITWNSEATNFNALAQNGYFVTATCTGTLPSAPNTGDTIIFYVTNTADVLTIQNNTGQTVRLGTAASSTAGTCTSNNQGDSITLTYFSTGSVWMARAVQGTWSLA